MRLFLMTSLVLSFCFSDVVAQAGHVDVTRGAMDPAVSPDGSTIAASVLGKIWLIPIDGGDAEQVSEGLGWDRRPAWSRDGRFLAYATWSPSGAYLVVRHLETGRTRFVHHTDHSIGHMQFGPEGEGIFFVEERGQYDAHLWKIDLDGSDARQLTFSEGWHEWSFALSPGGDRLLLESGLWGGADLYMLSLPDLDVERLTRSEANEFSVAWSADGRHRAYVRGWDGLDDVVIRTDDGEPRSVHQSPYDQKQITFHPDNRSIIMTAGRRLYRIDLASGETNPIPFIARFAAPNTLDGSVAITNARFLDVLTGDVRENTTVVVRDGRVVSVGGDDPPGGMDVIDAAGKTLMPGMMDNHRHYWFSAQGGRLIRQGITSVRDPGAAVSVSMSYKDATNYGLLLGPHIYSTGPLIDGEHGYHPWVDVSVRTPANAAALVRSLHEQGVDALKAYFMLDLEPLQAVVAEANRIGIPVTGHIGVRASWSEAMDAGIDGFSHIRIWRDVLPLEGQPTGRDQSLASSRNLIARMQADWRDIDPDGAQVAALIDKLVETSTAIDPTLGVHGQPEDARNGLSLEDYATGADAYARMGRFVANAVEAGVLLLAGTDNIDLVDELEAYAEFDVPNLEIIRSATVNGAKWFGQENEFGTLAVGTRADMILVDGDPLEDVSVLRNIALVVQRGTVVFAR